jgi:hypothetical protein
MHVRFYDGLGFAVSLEQCTNELLMERGLCNCSQSNAASNMTLRLAYNRCNILIGTRKCRAVGRPVKLLHAHPMCYNMLHVCLTTFDFFVQLPLAEREGIPHHLIDILPPDAEFSAGDFHHLGRKAAEDIIQASCCATAVRMLFTVTHHVALPTGIS